HGTSRQSKPIR
ncbi:tRNA synthetases class I (C) catalytic domain protein, partial [Vibrio parahaemolyticus V-223/04]